MLHASACRAILPQRIACSTCSLRRVLTPHAAERKRAIRVREEMSVQRILAGLHLLNRSQQTTLTPNPEMFNTCYSLRK